MSQNLNSYTERMTPQEADVVTFWEHIYRYRFASSFVANKRVLDIACGNGYGTASISKAGAHSVIGIDISAQTCKHARNKYGIDAIVASAEQIPLPDQSVDLIVSFETIEHLDHPDIFLKECARVLDLNGQLLISTPNRDVSRTKSPHNPFHKFEWNMSEFISALTLNFQAVKLFTQVPSTVEWWSLRSWLVRTSPWLRIKGFWRFVDFMRRWTCPDLWGNLKTQYRESPVETILTKDHPLAFFVNPYIVRNWVPSYHEQPKYLIALASVKKELSDARIESCHVSS